MSSSFDEVKLTAYALGELEGEEAREVEKMIASNQEARAYVEEMRKTGQAIRNELRKEQLPGKKKIGRKSEPNWPAIGVSVAALAFGFYQSRETILRKVEKLLGGVDYATERAITDGSVGAGQVASTWTDFSSRGPLLGIGMALLLAVVIVFAVNGILTWFNRDRR